jgi:hypothetical protein
MGAVELWVSGQIGRVETRSEKDGAEIFCNGGWLGIEMDGIGGAYKHAFAAFRAGIGKYGVQVGQSPFKFFVNGLSLAKPLIEPSGSLFRARFGAFAARDTQVRIDKGRIARKRDPEAPVGAFGPYDFGLCKRPDPFGENYALCLDRAPRRRYRRQKASLRSGRYAGSGTGGRRARDFAPLW